MQGNLKQDFQVKSARSVSREFSTLHQSSNSAERYVKGIIKDRKMMRSVGRMKVKNKEKQSNKIKKVFLTLFNKTNKTKKKIYI